MEKPDRWVVLKISENLYKIFATFFGGYVQGESWKVNSGIKKVTEDENFYYFEGYSGSIYKCHKKAYGINTSYGAGVLYGILNSGNGVTVEEDNNWVEFFAEK